MLAGKRTSLDGLAWFTATWFIRYAYIASLSARVIDLYETYGIAGYNW